MGWISWQSMGRYGPTRWSRNHYTEDGQHMLCGKEMPPSGQLHRRDGLGEKNCPRCERELARRRAT